jgi:hypothetical protein
LPSDVEKFTKGCGAWAAWVLSRMPCRASGRVTELGQEVPEGLLAALDERRRQVALPAADRILQPGAGLVCLLLVGVRVRYPRQRLIDDAFGRINAESGEHLPERGPGLSDQVLVLDKQSAAPAPSSKEFDGGNAHEAEEIMSRKSRTRTATREQLVNARRHVWRMLLSEVTCFGLAHPMRQRLVQTLDPLRAERRGALDALAAQEARRLVPVEVRLERESGIAEPP